MHFLLSYFYELRHQKLRMFLTILAVSWGMANVSLMLSVGEGLYQMMVHGISGMGEGIVVVWTGQTSTTYNGIGPGRPVRISEADVEAAKSLPLVKNISAEFIKWGVDLKHEDMILSKKVCGVPPIYAEMRNLIPEKGGRFLNPIDEDRKRRVIFIGNEIRDELFGEDVEAVGKTIWVNGNPFTVIGVMQHKFQMSMYSGSDAQASFIPASTYRTLFNQLYVSNVLYEPPSEAQSEASQVAIRQFIAARQGLNPDDEELLEFWDTYETKKMIDTIFRGLEIFFGIIGSLTLFIAGIGVANIMYVTVKERTREIGIKMAVGAHPAVIVLQFLVEAIMTVTIGGAIGIMMAMGMIELFNAIPLPQEFLEVTGRPSPVFSSFIALISVTLLNIIGLMAGIFPSYRASLIDPVEALRYE
ncbi:ABC transporter permease [Candidatus Latescibacterota bacterium]